MCAVVALMLGCGLRCAEVATITVDDWDRRGEVLRVAGKGGHERIVPVPPDVAAALAGYLAHEPAAGDSPIVRARTHPGGVRPDYLSQMVSRTMAAAGVKRAAWDRVSGHALRHTAATEVLDASGDLRVVQEMLGHQRLETTSVYLARAGVDRVRAAMLARHAS
jgi:site-specific recombinase XerD